MPPSEATTQLDRYEPSSSSNTARFLVCGLGSLGQHCVAVLREFGAVVSAIDQNRAQRWDIPNLLDELEELLIGDCCQAEVLQQANVQNCRAVLLVTSDERVNIEAAFAVRLLNPDVRLVVRSTKQNLNQLLSARLKNFVAFEATQLPAPAFAIAALGSEIRGFIHLGDAMLRVVKDPISLDHRWCDRRVLHELNTPTRRVLSYIPEGSALPTQFHQWEANTRVAAGDTIAYVEVAEGLARPDAVPAKPKLTWRQIARTVRSSFSRRGLQQRVAEFWRSTDQQQSKRVAIVLALAIVLLLAVGTGLLAWQQRTSGWAAFYTTAMMLLGQTETVIWKTDPKESIPAWLGLMNLVYMLAGTAAIAVLYALLTESLLAAKFQLPKKRPPLPLQDHVVLIGLGRVGRRVATLLQQLRQPLVGVSNRPLDATVLPQMPLVVSDWTNALTKVNLATARSVVVVTDDEMVNLEIGLMAQAANPDRPMVIRTFDPRFGKSVDRFLPTAKVLSAYELAAEAYVAAAFGENILNLIRLNEQTVLVTEYTVQPDDTLHGLLLADVAYGYDVVPILYQKPNSSRRLIPSDDIRLEVGDRLVVLATIDGLQRIERGEALPKGWTVEIERALSTDAVFDGSAAIARISGCPLTIARQRMEQLPGALPVSLHKHQAQRLVRELSKCQVIARCLDG